jgi:hypothetical protein
MATWLVHGLATCQTCGWEATSWRNAQATAAAHAKHHPGHIVKGEIGLAFEYPGQDEPR